MYPVGQPPSLLGASTVPSFDEPESPFEESSEPVPPVAQANVNGAQATTMTIERKEASRLPREL